MAEPELWRGVSLVKLWQTCGGALRCSSFRGIILSVAPGKELGYAANSIFGRR
ncbi:MAG: hypothetical protein PHI98_15025 [Eubacteriales bacterium]|nr:hypothetical protein [Eubacteriales bacterium]